MRGKGRFRRWAAAAVLGLGTGCVSAPPGPMVGPPIPTAVAGGEVVAVPPVGAVPAELVKITLPPYVVEAPDTLLIEVAIRSRAGEKKPDDPDGKRTGSDTVIPLPVQAISGTFQVRPDGSVGLGFWGSVTVSGLSFEQTGEAIRQHLLRTDVLKEYGIKPENLVVIVDGIAYNSKKYYVITDGGGAGEQVYPFPITGSETVLDAVGNIFGLPAVASKRNIWVARRCPQPGHPWQILPVDWVGITQHGVTQTNYQIMPGDRVYVKAQRLVTIDTVMARFLSPIERVFGITLLGSNTVNNLAGRGIGFNQ